MAEIKVTPDGFPAGRVVEFNEAFCEECEAWSNGEKTPWQACQLGEFRHGQSCSS